MPAYVLFDNVEVLDPEGLARYAAAAAETVAAHGGRYLTRPTAPEVLEGDPQLTAAVLFEFPDAEAARAWWSSPEYEALKPARRRAAVNTVVLLDGLPD